MVALHNEVLSMTPFPLPFQKINLLQKLLFMKLKLFHCSSLSFKYTSEVNIKPLVGVSTTRSLFIEDTESLSFSTHKQDIKEWVAPESNNTSKGIPFMKHQPWIRSLDFETSAPLRVKTFPVAFGCLVWSLGPPPFCSFLGCVQSL